ncbi:MAG TPA: glycosyltransferase, partial [Desulfomonilia bacterium]|nr:glycosyltransferase [Desulfomonilia bacterium]
YKDIEQYNPDVIIWRYTITSVPGIFNPKKVCPRVQFISEHQSKEIEELRMTLPGRLLSPIMKHNGRKVLRSVDGVIGVTSEITEYELSLIGRDIPSFTLTNSIDVEQYPLKKPRKVTDNTLRLLYVGSNTAEWHGLDRVLQGMADHRNTIRLELHIAGNVSGSIKKLIRSLNIEDHITSHGYITGEGLDVLFDLADVAIGTLGIHRKKLTNGSTLKVREYMARGIPFIISHKDEDLSPDFPYIFMAPSDESPIDMQAVIQFAKDMHASGEEIPQQMRTYASEHMDYRVKLVKLIEFINSLHHLS